MTSSLDSLHATDSNYQSIIKSKYNKNNYKENNRNVHHQALKTQVSPQSPSYFHSNVKRALKRVRTPSLQRLT
jgi:hypothetical protein